MRQILLSAVACLPAALSLLIAGCSSEPPARVAEAPKVGVMHPQSQELSDYEEFNGWLEPNASVDIRARVRGHISKVNFTDGQYVEKGQILFELDPRPFENEIGQAAEKVKIYEAQKVAAQKEESRLKELLKKGGASLQQVEKAEADTISLDAQIAASQSELASKKLDLEYSQIRSEIAGRVGRAQLTEGNLVNAGGSDPLLTTVVSVDPIRVYFNIDERSLQRYAHNLGVEGRSLTDLLAKLKDSKAAFSFAQDGEKQFSHEGTLAFGDNRIDPTTGTLQLYGTMNNKDGRFLPGARVRVRLRIGKPYPALLVPETAILADQDKRYVLIVDEKDKNAVRRRNVTLGTLTEEGMRAIDPVDKPAEGEKPGDWWVIVDNLQRARLNYPVDPQKPGSSAAAETASHEKKID
jgi:multidrug efflux system membrane fusion protein